MHSPLLLHQSIQNRIAKLIGEEKVVLEYRFNKRRADIYWPKQKIVFEIQCTPISLATVRERNSDYEAFDLSVVWILHQKTFNKTFVGPAENYMRSRGALYTNIFTNHTGTIYDQFEVINGHRRLYKSPPLSINITKPYPLSWQETMKKRTAIDTLYFEGKRAIAFSGGSQESSKKEKKEFSRIKSILKPFYKRFSHSQRATMLILYYLLMWLHRLRHFRGNYINSASIDKNRRVWKTQSRGESFHYRGTFDQQ